VPEPLRVIIVDDDPPARARVRALLAGAPDVEVVGECGDGVEAVQAIRRNPADVVFLDVQMPRLDGFGVVELVGPDEMPTVVFTSAYAEYAIRAFEAYALDYLLKPFDDARFAAALARARQQVAARRVAVAGAASGADARLVGLAEELRRPEPARYPEALAIKSGTDYVVVRVADIDWIEADGNYAKVYVQRRPRLLAKSLTALEHEVLDPERFLRVHRSAIVNLARIASAEPLSHGELTLVLHDGTRVDCSRRYRKRLEERLYFTS
jgi:two-component system, LytTR family, response regulator